MKTTDAEILQAMLDVVAQAMRGEVSPRVGELALRAAVGLAFRAGVGAVLRGG